MAVRPIRRRIALGLAPAVMGAALALAAPGSAATQAEKLTARQEAFLDDRIPADEREVMATAIGYAVPEFGDGVRWLGDEQPTFESLRGDVVVLHTWNSESTDGRAMTRRVGILLRRFREGVHQIALHTPAEAEEIVRKYERHSGKLPTPTAIDTEGAYLDELGLWKEPRIVVIGRDGGIRYAGVSMADLRDAVQEAMDAEAAGETPGALPPRSERIESDDKGDAEPVADAEWPAHNRIQAGDANNLQGQRGPALAVQEYINGGEPDTEGKVVMLEFWATWCGPCIVGIPHLNDLQNRFDDDLVIVGISAEDAQTVRNKMRTDNRLDFDYTIAVDPQRRANRVVGNRGIPHCIVMSSDGIVRWQGLPAHLNERTLAQIIEANRVLAGGGGGGAKRWVTDD